MSRMADSIKVQQDDLGGNYQLHIDGEEFPWHTMGGVSVRIEKGSLTGVTITVPARCVELHTTQDF